MYLGHAKQCEMQRFWFAIIIDGHMSHICRYVHVHVYVHIYTYIFICIYTLIHMYTCIHVYMHTYIHTYIHTNIHRYIVIHFLRRALEQCGPADVGGPLYDLELPVATLQVHILDDVCLAAKLKQNFLESIHSGDMGSIELLNCCSSKLFQIFSVYSEVGCPARFPAPFCDKQCRPPLKPCASKPVASETSVLPLDTLAAQAAS